MLFRIVLILIALSTSFEIRAESFRFRARESFEVMTIKTHSDERATFRGLSNTFNLVYEKPLDYAFGLAAGSIFSEFHTSDRPPQGFSPDLRLYFVGLEAKMFPLRNRFPTQGFARVGAYWNRMDTNGPLGTIDGYSLYGGVGYEFWIAQGISLAPEAGFKIGKAENLKSFNSLAISIGLHFYHF